ncbi:hypothetical protein C8J57DRAFT_1722280 [Mycena rebaudengoi]|nr:hypothetical protein C8J57DRAFT_1722280 [Mycena rebaudengoi]
MFTAAQEVSPLEPYTLQGVTKGELENLLWVYYNHDLESYYAPIIVTLALNHLGRAELDAIEKIKFCERDDLGRWQARDAYIEICTREWPLTSAEFQALGMDIVLLIMQIRERIIANRRAEARLRAAVRTDVGREARPCILLMRFHFHVR